MKGRHWVRRPSGLWTPEGIYTPTRFLTGNSLRRLGMNRTYVGVSSEAGDGVGVKGGAPAGVAQVGVATNAVNTVDPVLNVVTASRTLGSGSNRALIAVISYYHGSGTAVVSSVKFDSGGANEKSFTQVTGSPHVSEYGDQFVGMWYAVAPASGASGTITVVISLDVDFAAVSVTEWTGVNQTTPVDGYAEAIGSGTAISVTATTETGAVVVDVVNPAYTAGLTETIGAAQSEQYKLVVSGSTLLSSTQAGSAGGVMTWTQSTGRQWVGCAASINPI